MKTITTTFIAVIASMFLATSAIAGNCGGTPCINSADVIDGSILSKDLAPKTVSGVQIRNGAIFANKIAPGAVTPAKINATGAANGDVLTTDGVGNASWQRPTPQDTADQVRDKFFAGTSCTNPNNPNDVMVKVGSLCVDKYEASIWSSPDGTGTSFGVFPLAAYPGTFPANGNWTAPLYAASMPGVLPSSDVTWFQAQQACALSGKRLLTNAEWQMAAAGTLDPGTGGDGVTTCNTNTVGVVNAGNAAACVSNWGTMDMVGNVWEWVGDWIQGNKNPWAPSGGIAGTGYSSDLMLGTNPAANQGIGSTNMPAALVRGGSWNSVSVAGVFSLSASDGPAFAGNTIGFRCAQ